MLLRAWPEIRRRTGARLRLIGTDPLQYRLLHSRHALRRGRASTCSASSRTRCGPHELARGEGVRLARARRRELRARARRGVRDARRRSSPRTSPGSPTSRRRRLRVLVPPGDDARARGRGGRRCSPTRRAASRWAARRARSRVARYSWDDIARRLEETYERGGGVKRRRSRWRAADPGRRCSRSRSSLIWWRGPGLAPRPRRVHGRQLAVGRRRDRAQPALGARARARRGTPRSSRRCRRRTRASASSSPRSASACSRTSCCPAASASSRGSPCSRGGMPGRQGTAATLIGSVFAHRAVRPLPRARRSCLGAAHGEAARTGR